MLALAIDKRGNLWTGDSFDALSEYLVEYTAATSYPAGPIVQPRCVCGQQAFELRLDDEEGCAERRCTSCASTGFIADSADFWDDADPGDARCPCGEGAFELGVAFSLRDDGEVRWVTVGARCLACGGLGAYVDWKIDYSPTDHLLSATV